MFIPLLDTMDLTGIFGTLRVYFKKLSDIKLNYYSNQVAKSSNLVAYVAIRDAQKNKEKKNQKIFSCGDYCNSGFCTYLVFCGKRET